MGLKVTFSRGQTPLSKIRDYFILLLLLLLCGDKTEGLNTTKHFHLCFSLLFVEVLSFWKTLSPSQEAELEEFIVSHLSFVSKDRLASLEHHLRFSKGGKNV